MLTVGCGTKWINLDDSQASEEKVNKALEACNVEYMLKVFKDQKRVGKMIIASEKDVEFRGHLERAIEKEERNLHVKIEGCMEYYGLKQS